MLQGLAPLVKNYFYIGLCSPYLSTHALYHVCMRLRLQGVWYCPLHIHAYCIGVKKLGRESWHPPFQNTSLCHFEYTHIHYKTLITLNSLHTHKVSVTLTVILVICDASQGLCCHNRASNVMLTTQENSFMCLATRILSFSELVI